MAEQRPQPSEDERHGHSIPLETDDGEQVVIAQQTVGRQRSVGGGEFADPHEPVSAAEADRRQRELDEQGAEDGPGSVPAAVAPVALDPLPQAGGLRFDPAKVVGVLPVALFFPPRAGSSGQAIVVEEIDEHLADFGRARVQALVVAPDEEAALAGVHATSGGHAPVLADAERSWAEAIGVAAASDEAAVAVVVLDADGRVAEHWTTDAVPGLARDVLARIERRGLLHQPIGH